MPRFPFLGKFFGRINERIYGASQASLSLADGRSNFGQADAANHQQVNIAGSVLLARATEP